MQKIGQGSFGEVFTSDDGCVVKVIDKYDKDTQNINGFEITSICEMAILSIKELHEYIPKIIEVKEDDKKFYVYMEDCGYNLALCSKDYSVSERYNNLHLIALRLLYTSAILKEYELVHNDIKRPNVMINEHENIKMIDFGLCMFETIPYVDTNLIYNPRLNNNSCLNKEWGTYTIMPPEAFTERIWHQDCLMSWSIGITLCEFIFQTHTFIRDYVLDEQQQKTYKKVFSNDTAHKQFMKTFFENKIRKGDKYLIEFKQNDMMHADVAEMLNNMLILDYTERLPVHDLLNSKCFKKISHSHFNNKLKEIRSLNMYHIIHSPCSLNVPYVSYTSHRKEMVEWIFDILMICNKLGAFSFATQLFDKYLSIASVSYDNYILLAAACLYISQIKIKYAPIQIDIIVVNINMTQKRKQFTTYDVNNMILSVLRLFKFKVYMPSFEITVLKNDSIIDMKKVLETYLKVLPPYNNKQLIQVYNNCK
jgi:serine/threonine protein kinase